MHGRATIADNRGGKRHWLALLAAVGCFVVSCIAFAPAHAQSRHAAMIIDANSGETLHADKADEIRYPASLTKMMTLYMVFEQLEKGRLLPSSKIKVSQEAANAQPTKLDLEPGEQITVMDAVKALITKSANDMAIALAEAIGGSEPQFAELMTAKARAIGMRSTTFVNASGLPDTRQVTTARDMLTLALHLQDDYPKYFPLFALRSFSYNGATHRNHNTMLNSFEGIDGIKTGYTRMSGFNLVTSLHRGEKHLVGAVFGGTTAGTRNLTMQMLLTRALLKASTKKTRKPQPVLVARAKPATRPEAVKPAAVVATVAPVPAKPRTSPQPVAAAPAAAIPQPKQIASAAPNPEPAAEIRPVEAPAIAESTTPIEIAKVRPVMVAPRVKRNAFVILPDASDTPVPAAQPAPRMQEPETPAVTAAIAALADPTPASAAAPAKVEPMVPPIAITQPAVAAPAAPPVNRPAAIAPSRPPAPLPAQATPQVVAMHQPAAQPSSPALRGTLPSSLQAQAQNLGRGVPTSAALPAQPVAFAQPAAGGRNTVASTIPAGSTTGFHIQIGAFASAGEAERVLRDTQSRASNLLKTATPLTAPVQKENRMLYRARFAGFNAQAAASTCLELRRTAIDCFVMKAE